MKSIAILTPSPSGRTGVQNPQAGAGLGTCRSIAMSEKIRQRRYVARTRMRTYTPSHRYIYVRFEFKFYTRVRCGCRYLFEQCGHKPFAVRIPADRSIEVHNTGRSSVHVHVELASTLRDRDGSMPHPVHRQPQSTAVSALSLTTHQLPGFNFKRVRYSQPQHEPRAMRTPGATIDSLIPSRSPAAPAAIETESAMVLFDRIISWEDATCAPCGGSDSVDGIHISACMFGGTHTVK
jgi:hypothetical protein